MNRPQNTESPQSELASRLHDYFPQLSSDDIAKFETHLHEQNIAEERNGYRLNFVGREYARLQAGLPSDMLISPDAEHNAMPENVRSGNVFITGDNLEALRHLQNSYAGKVKMIYIDPPYNTGKEFVYKDHFELDDAKLKTALGYSDEDIARLRSIQCKSSHSAWLTFMYPRLALAKKLLTDDGVIFVSIDDNEQANLKLLMDDVFGEGNFQVIFPRITKKGGKSSDASAKNHDYVLMYAKSTLSLDVVGVAHNDDGYSNKDKYFEERGYYKINQTLDYNSLQYNKKMDYPIEIGGETFYAGGDIGEHLKRQGGVHSLHDWVWRWSKDLVEFGLSNGFIEIKRGGGRPRIYTKTYQNATIRKIGSEYNVIKIDRTKPLSTLEFTENPYSNDNAKKRIDELFKKSVFEYTKPPELLMKLMSLVGGNDFIVMDFFAGSGTTAQAVMQLNAEDGGSRRWMLVQLDEPTAENSEARRAGYESIDQISRERIRLATNKMGDKSGLKHYRLIEPEVRTLDKIETFDPNLGGFEDMITPMGGRETILTTWLIDDGYPFDIKIEEIIFDGYAAHYVVASQTLYLIDRGMTTTALKAMLNRIGRDELRVSTIVVYPYSFEFERMRELEIGVNMVDNLNLNKRY